MQLKPRSRFRVYTPPSPRGARIVNYASAKGVWWSLNEPLLSLGLRTGTQKSKREHMAGASKLARVDDGAALASGVCILDFLPLDVLPNILTHLYHMMDRYCASRATWRFEHALAQLGFRLHVRSEEILVPLQYEPVRKYTLHQFRGFLKANHTCINATNLRGLSWAEHSTIVLNKQQIAKQEVATELLQIKRRMMNALHGTKKAHAFDANIETHISDARAAAAICLGWFATLSIEQAQVSFRDWWRPNFPLRPECVDHVMAHDWEHLAICMQRGFTTDVNTTTIRNVTLKVMKKAYSDAAMVQERDALDGKARLLSSARKKWPAERKQSERNATVAWGRLF